VGVGSSTVAPFPYEPDTRIGAPLVETFPDESVIRYLPCGSWQLMHESLSEAYVPPGATTCCVSAKSPKSTATTLCPWRSPGLVC
jgi:hypothetical protein